MMARMLTQVPLPLLPRDAAEIAPGVGGRLPGMAAAWCGCTGWPRSRGMRTMRRRGGWPRSSWSS